MYYMKTLPTFSQQHYKDGISRLGYKMHAQDNEAIRYLLQCSEHWKKEYYNNAQGDTTASCELSISMQIRLLDLG